MKDLLIHDFTNDIFQNAFKAYFAELDIEVANWDRLFLGMNTEQGNIGIVRISPEGDTIGFIQFRIDQLKNWFFEEKIGFVRELWDAKAWRRSGHGAALMQAAENYFSDNHVYKAVLTTDTAPHFLMHQGYHRDSSYTAQNEDEVFIKLLS